MSYELVYEELKQPLGFECEIQSRAKQWNNNLYLYKKNYNWAIDQLDFLTFCIKIPRKSQNNVVHSAAKLGQLMYFLIVLFPRLLGWSENIIFSCIDQLK